MNAYSQGNSRICEITLHFSMQKLFRGQRAEKCSMVRVWVKCCGEEIGGEYYGEPGTKGIIRCPRCGCLYEWEIVDLNPTGFIVRLGSVVRLVQACPQHTFPSHKTTVY